MRLSKILLLVAKGGVRATETRKLTDGTLNPRYMVEGVTSIQTVLLSMGTLKVDRGIRKKRTS